MRKNTKEYKKVQINKFLLFASLLCVFKLFPTIITIGQEALYLNIGQSSSDVSINFDTNLVFILVFMNFVLLTTLTISIIGGMIYKNLFALFVSIFLALIEVFLNLGDLYAYIYFLAIFGLLIAGYKQIEEQMK